MPKRVLSAMVWVVVGVVFSGGLAAGGWMLYHRYRTGEWRPPTGDDLVRVKRAIGLARLEPSRTVYLRREATTLSGGLDRAAELRSSIVERAGLSSATTRGFRGSPRRWASIVSCVKATLEPFDIEIVTKPPGHDNYSMVVVGGRSKDLGANYKHSGGLAPFTGGVIPRAVAFVFSDTLRNRKRATCNAIAQEIAHTYGLDHAYNCADVMTYLADCGAKYFRDAEVPCGEHKPRVCASGKKTQNSFRMLETAVGLRR